MNNYFYKITNRINNKFYYGVHKTDNIEDGYMGSGTAIKYALKKYGRKNFKKEILYFFDTYKEALDYEERIVDSVMVTNPQSYNLRTGGKGGLHSEKSKQKMRRPHGQMSKESKHKMSIAKKGKAPWNKGKFTAEEIKQKMSIAKRGKKQSPEQIQKRADSLRIYHRKKSLKKYYETT